MPPPPFLWQGKSVVPVEFSHYELTLSLDVAQRRAVGLARISQPVRISRFPEVTPPDHQAKVWVLDVELTEGVQHGAKRIVRLFGRPV
jgi:hypothetical protein